MNRQIQRSLLLAFGILASTGCAGYDRIWFVTKTNIGLDIDDQPPTAEITIARRELAITPAFQDAQGDDITLPLLASFGLTRNFLNPEITSRFAGGEAAVVLAYGPNWRADHPKTENQAIAKDNAQSKDRSSLCLSKKPDTRPWWKKKWHSIFGRGNEETRAFYFATDTAFGLKVAWDGTTGPYPSTAKLGYNRKELAFPPVFATADPNCSTTETPPGEMGSRVAVPSFVASLDNSSTITDITEWVTGEDRAKGGEWVKSGVTQIQFFATGKAASEFVKRPEINAALNQTMYHHNKLSIDPMVVATTVAGTQTFRVSGGTGLVKFTLMQDTTGGAEVNEATGRYKAGPNPGTSVIGAADEAGNTTIATVTVKQTN